MAALPTSLGRTVPFTPVPGKYGYVTINGVNINVKSWSPTQNTNALDVTNFNSPQDANQNVHSESVAGVINTDFTIDGYTDASATGYRPTAGDTGTGVLGYNSSLYFPVSFLVTTVGGPQDVTDVGRISFGIKAIGLGLMTGRTGGA